MFFKNSDYHAAEYIANVCARGANFEVEGKTVSIVGDGPEGWLFEDPPIAARARLNEPWTMDFGRAIAQNTDFIVRYWAAPFRPEFERNIKSIRSDYEALFRALDEAKEEVKRLAEKLDSPDGRFYLPQYARAVVRWVMARRDVEIAWANCNNVVPYSTMVNERYKSTYSFQDSYM